MVDPITTRRVSYWGLFALIWALVMLMRLLPIDLSAGAWPGPNLTMLFAYAWVLRRPNFVPVLMIAALFFVDDMIFMRSPGLWAALSLIGLEFLRSRARFSRDLPFLVEWMMVASIIFAVMLANRLLLAVFVITQPGIGLDIIYLVVTIATYPLIVLLSSKILGVRQAAPGEVDQMGHRI